MKNNNYMCHVPYLKDSIAYDHDFWYTCVKLWYLQGFFHCFEIFTFWAANKVKGEEIAQNEKQQLHPSHAISEEQYRI